MAEFWRVRRENEDHHGRKLNFDQLMHEIDAGAWSEADQVRGPHDAEWSTIGDHPQAFELFPRQSIIPAREHEEAEPDMTPMIDMTFQLVIFFMITASFTVQKSMKLPSSKPDPEGRVTMQELEQKHVVVIVQSNGDIEVDGERVLLDDLPHTFTSATREKQNAEVILDVEDDVVHDTVVKVLDAAGAAEVERVLFVSKSKAPSGG